MEAPIPTVTERMARGRRRVATGAAAVFLAAWIAVIALGPHAHAHASGQSAPAGTTVSPDGSGDGGWFDDGQSYDGQAGGAQPGPTSEAPLTTSQS